MCGFCLLGLNVVDLYLVDAVVWVYLYLLMTFADGWFYVAPYGFAWLRALLVVIVWLVLYLIVFVIMFVYLCYIGDSFDCFG